VPSGELIFANVLDVRQRAAEGEMANGLVYLLAVPSRALPFAVLRDWKAPTGFLPESVELLAPSGAVTHRIGPDARYLIGSMDLTRFETVVEDAVFEELGGYVASFLLDGRSSDRRSSRWSSRLPRRSCRRRSRTASASPTWRGWAWSTRGGT
jgi:hypothetical protein